MVGLIRNVDNKKGGKETPSMHVITRKEWGAHPPMGEMVELEPPLSNIRITHTGSDQCHSHQECRKVLRKIQFEQMDQLGHPDIRYNFMIGGEGYVYEGRGWTHEPDRPNSHGELAMDSFEIAYIGDFEDEPPPASYLRAACELIMYAVQTKKVHYFFEGIHLQ